MRAKEPRVRDDRDLRALLERIDGRGYGAYRDLKGPWVVQGLALSVDHVQGDPFAAPSRVSVVLSPEQAGLDSALLASEARRIGVASFLARAFAAAARARTGGGPARRNDGGTTGGHDDRAPVAGREGSGRSGEIAMVEPGQEVLPQTAVQVHPDGSVEARFTVGLPARGRRILGRAALALLGQDVPALVEGALVARAHRPDVLLEHALVNEDAEALRAQLRPAGLVAFVADGAMLARRSGVDDRPLEGAEAVPFRAPDALRVTLEAPNAGPVTGMGVREGVTLIVGGGYHGKSTLLRALERGVYNHRPGDGREFVVTVPDAVKVRAEDGRAVGGVDISPFIGTLPGGRDTRAFTTPNASGSTSQAAAILEAVEVGATLLLVDEDTAATNFMIRDRRMQELVPAAAEPITPFVDRVRELYERWGVSSVLVIGGSGDYLDVADTVVGMRDYRAADLTAEARRVASRVPTGRRPEAPAPLAGRPARVVEPGSLDPRRGRRERSVKARGTHTVSVGVETIDLSAVEQLVHPAQAEALAHALLRLHGLVDGRRTVAELLGHVERTLSEEGLDALDARRTGGLAGFRRFELAAALNRARKLRARPATDT